MSVCALYQNTAHVCIQPFISTNIEYVIEYRLHIDCEYRLRISSIDCKIQNLIWRYDQLLGHCETKDFKRYGNPGVFEQKPARLPPEHPCRTCNRPSPPQLPDCWAIRRREETQPRFGLARIAFLKVSIHLLLVGKYWRPSISSGTHAGP